MRQSSGSLSSIVLMFDTNIISFEYANGFIFVRMTQRLVHSVFSWLPLTENWIYNQVSNLVGFDQLILCDETTVSYPDDFRVISKAERSSKILSRVNQKLSSTDWFRRRSLKSNDILFSHYGTRGFHDLGLCKKHITRFYGFDLNRIINDNPAWTSRYSKLFEKCDLFIAEGPFMKKQLEEKGCDSGKIYINSLGCSRLDMAYRVRKYDEGKMKFLIASSFSERKGIIYALQALGNLKQKNQLKNFSIDIVGDNPDQQKSNLKYKEQIFKTIREHSLEENIKWHGFMPLESLHAVALNMHILLHPSVWAMDGDSEGGYPIVIPELMATGLPVIATDHCDIPEVVNERNGRICREKNISDLESAILECMQPGVLQQLSKGARQTAIENFDQTKLSSDLGNKIRSVFSIHE
jgi:colanic acid/amylovoran biosynthesis glycosyltransferase